MKKVKITAIRKVQYDDLMAKYENRRTKQEQSQVQFTLNLLKGLSYALQGGGRPKVNPYSAMISCNDGFRPVSFYIETIEQ